VDPLICVNRFRSFSPTILIGGTHSGVCHRELPQDRADPGKKATVISRRNDRILDVAARES
jgi:hypothetical protein